MRFAPGPARLQHALLLCRVSGEMRITIDDVGLYSCETTKDKTAIVNCS